MHTEAKKYKIHNIQNNFLTVNQMFICLKHHFTILYERILPKDSNARVQRSINYRKL